MFPCLRLGLQHQQALDIAHSFFGRSATLSAPIGRRAEPTVSKRLAARALKPVDKAFWLRLAAYWLELGEKARRKGRTDEC